MQGSVSMGASCSNTNDIAAAAHASALQVTAMIFFVTCFSRRASLMYRRVQWRCTLWVTVQHTSTGDMRWSPARVVQSWPIDEHTDMHRCERRKDALQNK